MSSTAWVTKIFCPLLGMILCNATAIAPYKAVIDARKKKDLGDLNPFPFALIVNSQLGWILYAVLTRDYFIFLSSCFPFILGVILCMTAIHILERGVQHDSREKLLRLRLEYVLFSSMCYWMLMIFITCFILSPQNLSFSILIVGISSDISSLLYCAAPLSTIAEVIRTKDSSSLFTPSILISAVNSALWFLYGYFGVHSALIYIPNVIGVILCVIELIVRAIYPASAKSFAQKVAESTADDLSAFADDISVRVRAATLDFGSRIQNVTVEISARVRTASDAMASKVMGTPLSKLSEEWDLRDALMNNADGYENLYPQFEEGREESDTRLEIQFVKDNFA